MRAFEFLTDEAAGVGIVTKQNATADVPVGGEYMNVGKLFPKKKKKKTKEDVDLDEAITRVTLASGEKKRLRTYGKITNQSIINYYRKMGERVVCIDDDCDLDVKENSLIPDHIARPEIKYKKGEPTVSWMNDNDGELLVLHNNGKYMKLSPKNKAWLKKELNIEENFADGKVKGKSRPGRVKKAGASCKGSVTDLRAKAKKYGGEKGKMYHWCANMKGGKK